jgi:hypothetical protein
VPARDVFHDHVRLALERDGWAITHDPLRLSVRRQPLYVDLGAERVLAAVKGPRKKEVARPMDPLKWCDALERNLSEHAAVPDSHGDIRSEVVVDRELGRYPLVDVGWQGVERVHGALVHVDVIDGRFWIHHDGTEEGVATQLVAAGVPRDRIVLAFKHPDLRKYTDFAAE